MKRVLVLCTGNACRSQMAEGYLNFFAGEKALFYSAGLEDHGLNALAVEVMAEDNIDISDSRSKHYRVFKSLGFDFLITVCDEVNSQLPRNIRADRHLHFSIPDPAKVQGSPEQRLEAFRGVREKVKKHMLRFIGTELIGSAEAPMLA